jgi:hypothetical protein
MMVAMSDLFGLIWHAVIGLFRSRAALQAEILILRHQINILRRKSPKRVALGNIDRAVEMQKQTGLQLRNLYIGVVQEGVPDRFTELLRRLDAQDSPKES